MHKWVAVIMTLLVVQLTDAQLRNDSIVSPVKPSVATPSAMATSSSAAPSPEKHDHSAHDHGDSITTWHPDPIRAVWMGLIIPGYGQIYNRSYWKLPIVYGGLMGCIYAVTWTNGKYQSYKEAYRDIVTDEVLSTDPTRSYNAVLPTGYTIATLGGKDSYTRYLQSQQSSTRRYRDLSIVATVVVYALTLIDAYVDAQLHDFDISEDLSIDVTPQIYHDHLRQNQRSTELNLAIRF